MPGFTFLTYCIAWREGCGLGGDREVCRSCIKPITISTIQRPSEEKASMRCQHTAGITARLPQGQSSTEKPLAPWLSGLRLKEAFGVPPRIPTLELTVCRRHIAATQSHHLRWPNCCLSSKSFPPSATTVVFMSPFGQALCWLGLREDMYTIPVKKIPLFEL